MFGEPHLDTLLCRRSEFEDVAVSRPTFGDVNVIVDHFYRINFVGKPHL